MVVPWHVLFQLAIRTNPAMLWTGKCVSNKRHINLPQDTGRFRCPKTQIYVLANYLCASHVQTAEEPCVYAMNTKLNRRLLDLVYMYIDYSEYFHPCVRCSCLTAASTGLRARWCTCAWSRSLWAPASTWWATPLTTASCTSATSSISPCATTPSCRTFSRPALWGVDFVLTY